MHYTDGNSVAHKSTIIVKNKNKNKDKNNNHFLKVLTSVVIPCMLVLQIISIGQSSLAIVTIDTVKPCKCTIFRMDDVQDYWIQDEQIAAMNLFLSKNQSFSLGLIMHQIGNDSKIVNKVNEGSNKGLFELAIHGWDHVDYTKMSPNEQKNSMLNANTKMQKIFATKSNIFIPPYDVFDNSTLKAMSDLGIKIVSSATYAEDNFNGGESIFNATSNTQVSKDNKTIINNTQIYHLPATVSFKDYEGSKATKNSIKSIVDNATSNINKYGYAVIVLHPQDFAKVQNGQFINSVNSSEIKDLSSIVDILSSKNIPISSFSKTVGIK